MKITKQKLREVLDNVKKMKKKQSEIFRKKKQNKDKLLKGLLD